MRLEEIMSEEEEEKGDKEHIMEKLETEWTTQMVPPTKTNISNAMPFLFHSTFSFFFPFSSLLYQKQF